MTKLTRVISGNQAVFTDGATLTDLTLDASKINITSEVTVGAYGDGVLFHTPISTQFGHKTQLPGPILHYWTIGLNTKERRISREMMRFASASDALRVTQGPVVIRHQPEPVETKFLYTVVAKVSSKVHVAIRGVTMKYLERAKKGRELTFSYRVTSSARDVAMPTPQDEAVLIIIHDVDNKHLSGLLRKLSAAYEGYIARHDAGSGIFGSAIWHPYFDTTHGREWIQQLNNRCSAVVCVDVSQQRIRIYGDPVEPKAHQKIDSELSLTWIDLTKAARSTPSPQECPVCFEPTTDVHMSCGHMYCSDCFHHQIHTATSDLTSNEQFPVRCWSVGCETPISLQDLQVHLPLEKFDALLKASLLVYIRNDPAKYRCCPQPNCTGVFLTSEESTFRTCSVCLNPSICVACNKRIHPGLKCAQVELSEAGLTLAATGEWHITDSDGNDASIKQCPKCEALTQKGSGCGHMQCVCGVQWCWACRELFHGTQDGMTAVARCYQHMNKVYGGIFVD